MGRASYRLLIRMARLASLGRVVKVIKKLGVAVVRLESSEASIIGARVFSQPRAEVGKIVDVIGRVSSPYAVIKLKGEVSVGAPLLYEARGPGGRRPWRSGRRTFGERRSSRRER